jgi:hypothetical protein
MARPPNESESIRVEFRCSREVAGYLDTLARHGVHGKNRSEVAKTLVGWEIERLIREAFLVLQPLQ